MKSFSLPLTLAVFSMSTMTYAYSNAPIPAPFYQVEVTAKQSIVGSYRLGARQVLVCKESFKPTYSTAMQWKFNGMTYKKMLPVMIKNDERYHGDWADNGGYVTITNEKSPETVFVTCEYFTME